EDRIHFSIAAPTNGWVLVGFNDKENIVGSHLVFGAVEDGFVMIEDHCVTAYGQHRSLFDLASSSSIRDFDCYEANGKTAMSFSLPTDTRCKYAFDLNKGQKIYIWLAYSESDDFNHHSRKRIGRWITL
ncbi:MAG: hypothetical protein KI790_20620, partial [Cyclobacteriaceae bacterium]|nr:hypothetical protein [Cyclobacteriaceae bacterium HetDA_MAG_MS6]